MIAIDIISLPHSLAYSTSERQYVSRDAIKRMRTFQTTWGEGPTVVVNALLAEERGKERWEAIAAFYGEEGEGHEGPLLEAHTFMAELADKLSH